MKQKKIDVEGEIQMHIVEHRPSQMNTYEPEEYRKIQMQSENTAEFRRIQMKKQKNRDGFRKIQMNLEDYLYNNTDEENNARK